MNSIAVKAGREFMDATHPGWRERINWDTLDLRIWSKCVLGQGCGGISNMKLPPGKLVELGFQCDHTNEANQHMIELWKKEVNGS